MSAPRSWADGMKALHDEAAGAVMVEVIRPIDVAGLIGEALAGSAEAIQCLRLRNGFIRQARRSSPSKPMLCGCCPRSIRRNGFSVVLALPYNQAAENALALGVCERCGTEPAELLDRARQALARVWPDVRPITIHPIAGRA